MIKGVVCSSVEWHGGVVVLGIGRVKCVYFFVTFSVLVDRR